ncbi:MAG: Blue-light-activated protein, partial [Armatimonadetes bacterium]|nr:Blue-light-activated protein [Armatimonadota bacterium]
MSDASAWAPESGSASVGWDASRLRIIAEITGAVVGAAPLSEQVRRLSEQIRQAFAVDATIVRLLDGDSLKLLASAGVPEAQLLARIPVAWGISCEILSTQRPITIRDIRTHPVTRPFIGVVPPVYEFVSYAGVPLLVEGQVVGILGIYTDRDAREFSAEDLELLRIVASHIALAVENDRLYRQVERQTERLKRHLEALRQAKADLGASEQLNELIVENSPCGISLISPDGSILRANDRARAAFGLSEDRLGSLHLEDYDDLTVREDGTPFPVADYPVIQCLATGEPRGPVTIGARRPDGTINWSVYRAAPLPAGEDGQPTGAVLVFLDVTDQKRAHDDLRSITSGARCLLWHADLSLADSGELGWTFRIPPEQRPQAFLPLEVPDGETYEDAFFASRLEEDRIAAARYGGVQVRAGKGYSQEFRHLDRMGALRWLREDVDVRVLGPGRWRAVGVCTDVTERRRLEEQLGQAQKMEAVGRLAGGVAHDFNNMLAVINGYSELLLMRLPPEEPTRPFVTEILKAGERAADLTRQLLAFSRRQIVSPRVLNLTDLVAGTHKMLRRLISENIELVTIPAPDLGTVRADAGQIEQALVNLAVNARDAMPDGGKLTIRLHNLEVEPFDAGEVPAGRYVVLEVSDTGTGIPAEILPHIFEPFFTTKEVGQGTGLGLATVYGITQQSGGFVTVHTGPGEGT